MSTGPRHGRGASPTEDDLPVRVMTVLGLIRVIVLLASAGVLAVSWPSTPQRSPALAIRLHARPGDARIVDRPQKRFREGRIPAATIDEGVAGAAASTRAGELVRRFRPPDQQRGPAGSRRPAARPVPLSATSAVPAGTYRFVLAAVRGNRAEEVLVWVHVEIEPCGDDHAAERRPAARSVDRPVAPDPVVADPTAPAAYRLDRLGAALTTGEALLVMIAVGRWSPSSGTTAPGYASLAWSASGPPASRSSSPASPPSSSP